MNTLDPSKLSDREILILLQERQSVMADDVKEVKDGTSRELSALQIEVSHIKESKADKTKVDQLERGQQRLFNYLWGAFGALAVLQVIIPIGLNFLLKH